MKSTTTLDLSRRFDEANLRAAREILRYPHMHGGELAFPVTWAHAVIARLGKGEHMPAMEGRDVLRG